MLKIVKKHKIISLVMLLALIGGGYYAYAKFSGGNNQVSYLTSAAQKGTVIASVSSSGQISSSNQVDIKPKVSGDITKISVAAGQEIKSGQIIAQIDATDAYKSVRDAQTNLESALLSLNKLKQAADANSVLQAQNSITSARVTLDKLKISQPIDLATAQNNLQNAQTSLDKAYNDAFTAVSNSFLNLPNIITALDDILYSEEISASEISLGGRQVNIDALFNSTYETDRSEIIFYQNSAESDYAAAKKAYDTAYLNFKNDSVYSAPQTIENLLAETLAASKAVAQAIKSENNYLDAWSDSRSYRNWEIFSKVTTYKTNLTTYAGQANTASANLLSAQTTIKTNKDAITSADNSLKTLTKNQPLDLAAAEASLKEKQSSLDNLMAGTDPLDIKSQELTIQQRRNSLYDAQRALADYTVKAPFDGVIAAVNLKVGDSAGSEAIATAVTKQQIAEISLNEVDAAKVKLDMKANLTFDAVEGLTITGKVAEIDTLGAVSQGVVTYNVKIVFDTQDERVKSGMSTNAVIITDSKTDALLVPGSAVKTDGNGDSYVQLLGANEEPFEQAVQIGLTDDTNTEIISGLNEGDKVVTQTINSNTVKTTTATGSGQRTGSAGGFMIGSPR